jgi:L-amino acid N-acyltransferase YncA
MVNIRHANPGDLESITDIYNQAILKTTATFDIVPKTLDEQRIWFERHDLNHPILVAESDETVVGWASLSEWSDRCAYSDTAEVSLYIKEECREKGIGRKLLEALVSEGARVGLHTLIARIAEGNNVSIHLHEAFGFQHVGIMKEVGKKFGRLIDVHLMQKLYGGPTRTESPTNV